jgi:hypothetical protein
LIVGCHCRQNAAIDATVDPVNSDISSETQLTVGELTTPSAPTATGWPARKATPMRQPDATIAKAIAILDMCTDLLQVLLFPSLRY